MTDATAEFLDRLSSTDQPLLGQMTATIRLDLDDRSATRHWLLAIDKGTVAVSERESDADVVVRTSRSLFDRLVTGEANALASTLRGQIAVQGDPQLMVAFQRVLPGPARQTASLPTKGQDR